MNLSATWRKQNVIDFLRLEDGILARVLLYLTLFIVSFLLLLLFWPWYGVLSSNGTSVYPNLNVGFNDIPINPASTYEIRAINVAKRILENWMFIRDPKVIYFSKN